MGAPTSKSKSVLLGFSVCPLCGGKTHVKRIDAEGKKAYSHCLDEHDKGCSHTHYSTNRQQEELMLAKTRPLAGQAAPGPVASPAPAPAPEPIGSPSATPSPTPTPPKRVDGEEKTTEVVKPSPLGFGKTRLW